VPLTARVERPLPCSFQSCSFLFTGGCLLDLPLRASTHSPFHFQCHPSTGVRNFRLRPSNEHILIVRVPGAKKAPHSRAPLLLRPRVARAQEINRPPNPSFPTYLPPQRGGLVGPQLRASNEALPRARVPRARRTREPAPSHPLRRILLPCLFFCEPPIQGRQHHQRKGGRGEEAADDDGRERPLHFGSDPLREHQRQQS